MEGHPVTLKRRGAGGGRAVHRALPRSRNCRTSNNSEYLPARSEWPEEPEAYEEFPEAEEFEDDGERVRGFLTPKEPPVQAPNY